MPPAPAQNDSLTIPLRGSDLCNYIAPHNNQREIVVAGNDIKCPRCGHTFTANEKHPLQPDAGHPDLEKDKLDPPDVCSDANLNGQIRVDSAGASEVTQLNTYTLTRRKLATHFDAYLIESFYRLRQTIPLFALALIIVFA